MASVAEMLRGVLQEDLSRVEELLRSVGQSKVSLVPEIFYHTLDAGGKRIRPALALLAGRAVGEVNERTFEVAAAVELIHLASLLHDDVVDASPMRRGRPTAHTLWGNKSAILVADYLFAMAFTLLTRHPDPHVVHTVSLAVDRMCEGELAQLENEGELDLSESQYLEMIADKTGSLMAVACELGAYVSGAGPRECRLLHTFGLKVGTAFQMADDLLDLLATEGEIGKPVGNDVRCGRITLPIIYTLRHTNGAFQRTLRELLTCQPMNEEIFQKIRSHVRASGGVEYAQQKAKQLIEEAKDLLEELPPTPARLHLARLADYVLLRSR